MKTKTLLLAGLAAFALASCGMKKYENEVSKEKFAEKLEEALAKNPLSGSKDYFSFEFKMEKESKSVDTYYKNDKKLSKTVMKAEEKYSNKFDASKSVCKIEEVGESTYESESTETSEKVDLEMVYQCDTTARYDINVTEKTYKKTELENPSASVASKALTYPASLLSAFSYKIMSGDKFYVDENVFTIEEIFDEEDESKTKVGKTVYQLVVEDEEISYYEEMSLEIKEVNLKTVDEGYCKWTFEKRDVSLKQVDLEKYLKVSL